MNDFLKNPLGTAGKFLENVSLPQVGPEIRRKLDGQLPKIREDLDRFSTAFKLLEENYPSEFVNLRIKYPTLMAHFRFAKDAATILGSTNTELSNDQIMKSILQYNRYAIEINRDFARIREDVANKRREQMLKAAKGELEFDENVLDEEQKELLHKFAKDLWAQICPDSRVDRFVQWTNEKIIGDPALEGYQKILLAPANGIEGAIVSVLSLFNPRFYKEVAQGVSTAFKMSSADYRAIWRTLKLTYRTISTSDKISAVISMICGFLFLLGGIGKLSQILDKLKYPPATVKKLKIAIESIVVVDRLALRPAKGLKMLPLGVLAGLSLDYINLP